MSKEQDKTLARDFLHASIRHDASALALMMTDDATYWVQCKSHLSLTPARKPKKKSADTSRLPVSSRRELRCASVR